MYDVAIGGYLSDLATAEESFARTLDRLADHLAAALDAGAQRMVPDAASDAPKSTMRKALADLAQQTRRQARRGLDYSRTLKEDAARVQRLDVDANRRNRAARARLDELNARVDVAERELAAARKALADVMEQKTDDEPPSTDPWLLEINLQSAVEELATSTDARDTAAREEAAAAAVTDARHTDAVAEILQVWASAHRGVQEHLRDIAGERLVSVRGVDGSVDMHTSLRALMPDGDAAGIFRSIGAPSRAPAVDDPTQTAAHQAVHTRNMAQVEKVGELSTHTLFSGWCASGARPPCAIRALTGPSVPRLSQGGARGRADAERLPPHLRQHGLGYARALGLPACSGASRGGGSHGLRDPGRPVRAAC